MGMDDVKRLYEAAKNGSFEDVKEAFEACSFDERRKHGRFVLEYAAENYDSDALDIMEFLIEQGLEPISEALYYAAGNVGPHALDIVKLLMERGVEPNRIVLNRAAGNNGSLAPEMVKFLVEKGVKPDTGTLHSAVTNEGPYALEIAKFLIERGVKPDSETLRIICRTMTPGPHTLGIVEFVIERGADPHEKNGDGNTAFTSALDRENFDIADYLLSRDNFFLSDLMPCPENFSIDTYKTYREKAISRIGELIDAKGIVYAKTVAADIEKVLKTKESKPTKEDIEVLEPLVNKLSSKDWVAEAWVTSGDFECGEIAR